MKDDLETRFRTMAANELPRLRRFARAVTRDPHHADDLVQGALERMYVAWPRTHEVADPGAYLRTIVVRLAVSESRRPWRRRERSTDLAEERSLHAPDSSGPRDPSSAAIVRLDLARALTVLTVKQRAIVVMRYLEDRSVAEVAAVMGVAEGTVKRQSADAVATLRRTLGNDFLDDGSSARRLGSGTALDADPTTGGTR